MEKHAVECIFCDITKGKIHSYKIYENSHTFAFLDINPRNPGHALVVPKKHYETIFDIPEKDVCNLFKSVKKVSAAIKKGMKADGISIAQSNETAAGQEIHHIHVHVIPRFSPEDPVSIEGMLPLKLIKKREFPKIAARIRKNVPRK